MAKYHVQWEADGAFALEAEDYESAEDKAYDMVRDYVDARQIGGEVNISEIYEEN